VPALQVKSERDVIDHRVAGTDIDIKAVLALAEAAHQVDVFEMLGVGKHVGSGGGVPSMP
jgi:hypothetical protein